MRAGPGAIQTPLILENITATVCVPGGEMDEAEFVTAVLDRTGCGRLCDVTNLYTNAVNHGCESRRDPRPMAVGSGGSAPLCGRTLARRLVDRQPRPPDARRSGTCSSRRRSGAGSRDHPGARREPAAVCRAGRRARAGAGDREAARAMGLAEIQGRWRGCTLILGSAIGSSTDPAARRDRAGARPGEAQQLAASLGGRSSSSPPRSGASGATRCAGSSRWQHAPWDPVRRPVRAIRDEIGASGIESRP